YPLILALLFWRRNIGPALAGLVNALVLYEGGLHVFVWFNAAIGLFALVSAGQLGRRLWRPLVYFASTALVARPKWVAVLEALGRWERVVPAGYSTAADVWGLLTDDQRLLYQAPFKAYNTVFYDASLFHGRVFLLALAAALVWAAVRFAQRKRG